MAVTGATDGTELQELREAYRAFIEEHVLPAEEALFREDDAADALLADLRARAKAEGLWAPHLPPAAGGTGRGFPQLRAVQVAWEQPEHFKLTLA